MAIPLYEEVKLPVLKAFADAKEHHVSEIVRITATNLHLSSQDIEEALPSGGQTRWANRVNWSCIDLLNAGMLQRVKRGWYKITAFGQETLAKNPTQLTRDYLEQNSTAFSEWMKKVRTDTGNSTQPATPSPTSSKPPTEQIEDAYITMRRLLADDLLAKLKSIDPFKFEQLVLDVLVAMGYGGSRAEAAKVTQRSSDEGIDGIINEDRLGLDSIYVQAKRWQNTVGRKELQAFVGALAGQGASKGIFITSGEFASTAQEYVKKLPQKVILIDGTRLVDLMIDHDVGVSKERTYTIKKTDSDYFEEE